MTTKAKNTPGVVFGGVIDTTLGTPALIGQGYGIKDIVDNGVGDVSIDLEPECAFNDGDLAIIGQVRGGAAATPWFPCDITRVTATQIRVKLFKYTATGTVPAATDGVFYLAAHRIMPGQRP